MRFVASALLSLPLIWISAARADEAAGDGKPASHWKLFAECRMARIPQKSAIPLIADFGEPQRVNDAWDHLGRMLEGGQATLEADLIVQGSEDKVLVSKSMEELKYATEYEPPQLPERLPWKTAREALKTWPFIGVAPTAFETRNVGETLKFAARVLDDGALIALTVDVIHTRLREQSKFEFAELPGGEKLSIHQPEFNTLRTLSSFRLRNGEKILLGVHKLTQPAKAFELFVLQVKASRAGETH